MKFIICDTRQQEGKHDKKHGQIAECGVHMLTCCMPCGDYCSFDELSDETKDKVSELSFQYSLLKNSKKEPDPKLRKEVSHRLLNEIKISVDTKQNLNELSKNLMNRSDRSRFWKEVRKAKEHGIRLIILCEHGGQIKSIPDVAKWHSKYSPVSGRALMDEIYRVHISYGVDFIFCDKRNTGKKIIELLGGAV